MRKTHISGFLIALVVVLLGTRYEWRARHGYCFKADQYKSAQELATGAMRHVFRTYIQDFDRRLASDLSDRLKLKNDESLIKYNTVEDFLAAHSNNYSPRSYDTWESKRRKKNSGRYARYMELRFKYKSGSSGKAKVLVRMDGYGGQPISHIIN